MTRAWRNKNLNERRKGALARLKRQPTKKDPDKQRLVDQQLETLESRIRS